MTACIKNDKRRYLLSLTLLTWMDACTGLPDAKLPTATHRLNLMILPLADLVQLVPLQVSYPGRPESASVAVCCHQRTSGAQ